MHIPARLWNVEFCSVLLLIIFFVLYNMYCIVATYKVNAVKIILSLNLHLQELLQAMKIKL